MTKKTVSELLAESRELRNSLLPAGTKALSETVSLPWHYFYLQVLGAVGFSWYDMVWHCYPGEHDIQGLYDMNMGVKPQTTIVIHGHSRGGFCCANTCCHVLGYKPNGDLPPALLTQWKKFGYEPSL